MFRNRQTASSNTEKLIKTEAVKTCPLRGADFDLELVAALGPPTQKGVSSYKVMVKGDDIKGEV
jgi:nitrite reductase/ring-hydroxylating ferredoxin subunit